MCVWSLVTFRSFSHALIRSLFLAFFFQRICYACMYVHACCVGNRSGTIFFSVLFCHTTLTHGTAFREFVFVTAPFPLSHFLTRSQSHVHLFKHHHGRCLHVKKETLIKRGGRTLPFLPSHAVEETQIKERLRCIQMMVEMACGVPLLLS